VGVMPPAVRFTRAHWSGQLPSAPAKVIERCNYPDSGVVPKYAPSPGQFSAHAATGQVTISFGGGPRRPKFLAIALALMSRGRVNSPLWSRRSGGGCKSHAGCSSMWFVHSSTVRVATFPFLPTKPSGSGRCLRYCAGRRGFPTPRVEAERFRSCRAVAEVQWRASDRLCFCDGFRCPASRPLKIFSGSESWSSQSRL